MGGWVYHPHGNSTWYSIKSTTENNDLLTEQDARRQ